MAKLRIKDGKPPHDKKSGRIVAPNLDPAAETAVNAAIDSGMDEGVTGADMGGGADSERPNWDQFFRDLRRGKK